MIKTIDKVNFSDKRVLIRVDFNVPLDDDLKITDYTRILESLPTIDKVIDDGGIPILISHLGRPKGVINQKYSLKPVADYLKDTQGYNVIFVADCIGPVAQAAVDKAVAGDVVLIENLRFYNSEEKNEKEMI